MMQNLKLLIQACKKKYERGINVVDIDYKYLRNGMITPHSRINTGRIFLTAKRVEENVIGLTKDDLEMCYMLEKIYDPNKEVIIMFILVNAPMRELHFFFPNRLNSAVTKLRNKQKLKKWGNWKE